MSDPACPRCRGLEHPVDTLLAALIWTPAVARSAMVQLAVTMYLRGHEYELAEWLIKDSKAHPAEDQVAQLERLRQERPRLETLHQRVSSIAIEVVHAAPISALLDRLAYGTAFPAKPERPARVRKRKPRAWEHELRIEAHDPDAAA